MATHKRIDGDYFITSVNPEDYVVIDTNTVEIHGNLDVAGNLTYINVTELNVKDPFILLNSSNTASYPSNSGILTHKTSSTFAGIRYNNNSGEWELSVSTGTTGETGSWVAIATGNALPTPGGANTNIQFSDGSTFGGNANFSFDYATAQVLLDGTIVLGYQPLPTASANTTTIFANIPGSGGTGLYIKDTSTEDELVSKTKAIVFSIIF